MTKNSENSQIFKATFTLTDKRFSSEKGFVTSLYLKIPHQTDGASAQGRNSEKLNWCYSLNFYNTAEKALFFPYTEGRIQMLYPFFSQNTCSFSTSVKNPKNH